MTDESTNQYFISEIIKNTGEEILRKITEIANPSRAMDVFTG